jgi:hypothetical protein
MPDAFFLALGNFCLHSLVSVKILKWINPKFFKVCFMLYVGKHSWIPAGARRLICVNCAQYNVLALIGVLWFVVIVCVPSQNAMKDFSNSSTQTVLIFSIFLLFHCTYFIFYAASSIFLHPLVKDMRKWLSITNEYWSLVLCVCLCARTCVYQ